MPNNSLALVLACDLAGDGNELGLKTVARLSWALEYQRYTRVTLVVAASFAPNFPKQRESMAQMMARQLFAWGCKDVCMLKATEFNTRGELAAFFQLRTSGQRSIISAGYHLRRTKLLVRQMYGKEVAQSISYIVVESEKASVKEKYLLEPLKLIHVYLPAAVRGAATRLARMFFSTSW